MRHRVADYGSDERLTTGGDRELASTNKAVEDAIAAAEHAAHPGAEHAASRPWTPTPNEPPPAAPTA